MSATGCVKTASSVIYLGFSIVIGIIGVPLCLYSIYQFYGFRDDRRFRKRHGKLSTFTAVWFVGELFSGSLLTLAFSGCGPPKLLIAFAWTGDILNFTSYFLIIHFLVLRFWCLYYDIKYQLSTNDNVWKALIDEHYVINDEHLSEVKSFDLNDDLWFIKNRKKQGNSKWMLKVWLLRSFMVILTVAFLMLLTEMIFERGWFKRGIIEVIFTTLFFVPFGIMIYIYHRIPQFHDTYFIRKEIIIIHNIDLIDVVASAIVSIIANYGIYTGNQSSASSTSGNPYQNVLDTPWLNILMLVTFWIMGISHCFIVYFMTFWVRNKIIEDQQHLITLTSRASNVKNKFLTIFQIIEHQYGFELFMEHLSDEFSIENLLSLTEFMQYKCMIMERNKEFKDSKLEINLPMGYIPKSTIVYPKHSMLNIHEQHNTNTNTENELKEIEKENTPSHVHIDEEHANYAGIVYELYYKYIRTGAELEINISYEARHTFHKYIDTSSKTMHSNIQLTTDEYLNIFNRCILEILTLIKSDSYARFSHSERYKTLKNALDSAH